MWRHHQQPTMRGVREKYGKTMVKRLKIALAASVAVLALISLMSIQKAQAASSVIDNPTHLMDGTWTVPASTSDDHTIQAISADITPLTDNPTDGYFYAAEFYYSSITGYMGLQNNGVDGNGKTVSKTTSITIYGASSASPENGVLAGCVDRGEGKQCNLNYTYNWETGHTYRFYLAQKVADDGKGSEVWTSKFQDVTTNVTIQLGTLNVPVSQKYLSHSMVAFHERFSGPTDNCSSIKPSFVTFSNVIMDGVTATASSTFGHIGNISGCPGYLDNYLLNNNIYSGFGPNIKSYEPAPPPALVSAGVSPNVDKLIKQFVSDNSAGGVPGVVFKDLDAGKDYSANSDSAITAASLYKLFVAHNLYSQKASGSLSFSQKIPLIDVAGQWEENKRDCKASSDTDPCVTAIWPSKPLGQSASVDDCLPKMIIYSDNICGATFLDYGRTHGLYNLLSAEGYSHTSLAPGSLQTSPSDVAKLLTLIAQNKLVSSADSQEIYGLMLKQAHRAKIPAGIPSLTVANKTGEIHDSSAPKSHDAAIVQDSGKTYILVVMTHLNPDSSVDDAKIATFASQIFGHVGSTGGSENCTTVSSSGSSVSSYDINQQLQWPWYVASSPSGSSSSCCSSGSLPSSIPEPFNSIFTQAAAKYNISPALLAAVFDIENGQTPSTAADKWPHFSEPGPFSGSGGPWPDNPPGVGARGPFQFEYTTWWDQTNHNGYVNSNPAHTVDTQDLTAVSKSADDLTDSAFAAAKYMANNGGTVGASDDQIKKAILSYNSKGGDAYVNPTFGYYQTYSQGGTGSSEGCGGGVILDGHTFPLPLKTQADYDTFGVALSPVPCTSGCHHDDQNGIHYPRGIYAFDLGMKYDPQKHSEGAPTLAISDGKIKSVRYDYNNSNCNSVEFESTTDGYIYWYGHTVGDHSIQAGQVYKVGEIIGHVGPSVCANNTEPHLHIDRGWPKGTAGGNACCRDEGIYPLINGLFEAIPK